jgi:NAD(P)H dehydrogenase (quinone)
VPETLSPEVLAKMHAPAKSDHPIATAQTLVDHDAFLFGVPTRYGNMPTQFKVISIHLVLCAYSMKQALWDATGQIWVQGALAGKYAGLFVSTGSPGGGQEMTISNYLSTLTHHGVLFVPFGYATGLQRLLSLEEVHGGEIRLITVLGSAQVLE